jgi:hypothetical protein
MSDVVAQMMTSAPSARPGWKSSLKSTPVWIAATTKTAATPARIPLIQ